VSSLRFGRLGDSIPGRDSDFSHQRPHRFWCAHSLPSSGYWGDIFRSKTSWGEACYLWILHGYSAQIKNAWGYTSTVPYVFTACCLIKHRDDFTFGLKTREVLRLYIRSCVLFVRVAFPLHKIHETWQAKSFSFGTTNFVLTFPVRWINALFWLHQLEINELFCYLSENSDPWQSTVHLGMKDEGPFYSSCQLGLLFW
jgi:hypothetical protein